MADNGKTLRTRGRPSTRHAKRREDILQTAAGVFAEKGYHGASMRDIAARLGMRQAALYYYFASKAAILEAICREGLTHFVGRLGEIASAPCSPEEKLRRAVRTHLEPLIEQRFYVHAFLFQRRDLPKAVRRPLDAEAHAYMALWRAIIADGQRSGAIAADLDSELTVLAILGMCNTVARWSRAAAEFGLDRVAASFTRLIAFGLFDQPRRMSPKERARAR